MCILIYSESEKVKLKKDCFELASYASLIAKTLELEVHALQMLDNCEPLVIHFHKD